MDKIYQLCIGKYGELTKGERKIAEYFVKCPKQVLVLSSLDLGKKIGVSDASILRFSKKMGFQKFTDFKSYIAEELSARSVSKRMLEKWDSFSSPNDIANKIVHSDLKNLEMMLNTMDVAKIETCIDLFDTAKDIYFMGLGTSRPMVEFMHWQLRTMGYRVHALREGGLNLYEELSHIGEEDLLFVFAFPRFLVDEVRALELAKKNKAKIVTLCNDRFSEISLLSDLVFKMAVRNEAFFNSYVVPMEFCNILLTALFEKNKKEIYERVKKNSNMENFLFTSESD